MKLGAIACALLFLGLVLVGTVACGKKAAPRPPDEAIYKAQ